jgi:putative transposase
MKPTVERRKRVIHFDEPGHCHELTFSCYQRMPLLTNDTWREMLSRSIERAAKRHCYRLVAFVFMPEHVHLLVFPLPDASKIDALLRAIKRPYSFRIKRLLEQAHSHLLNKLTIRQRPGTSSFRFWQEGPGYDRNITETRTLELAIDYIHLNPVRRGLCDRAADWRWSSARYYHHDQHLDSALPAVDGVPPAFVDMPSS